MPVQFTREAKEDTSSATPKEVSLVSGVFLWGFLCLIPLWNASLMMRSPVFLHFYGQRIPCGIVLTCVLVLVAYLVSVGAFYRFAKKGAITERNLLLIGSSYVTLLGALFLLISFPMFDKAGVITDDILNNCQHGISSEEITQVDRDLRIVKKSPQCVDLNNIEDCETFAPSYSAFLLKSMEEEFRCSGWCLPTDTVGYPRTLFSSSDFEVTCDGAVARSLNSWIQDASRELFYEGIYLLIMAVTIGMLQMCRVLHEDYMHTMKAMEHGRASYGAMEHG